MAAASVKLFWGVRNNVVAEIDDVTGARRLGISSAINFHEWHSLIAESEWPKLWHALATKLGRPGEPPAGGELGSVLLAMLDEAFHSETTNPYEEIKAFLAQNGVTAESQFWPDSDSDV